MSQVSMHACNIGQDNLDNDGILDLKERQSESLHACTLDSYGILRISWGLGIGSYLFIAAAITKLAAGIIVRKAVGTKKQETKENQKS